MEAEEVAKIAADELGKKIPKLGQNQAVIVLIIGMLFTFLAVIAFLLGTLSVRGIDAVNNHSREIGTFNSTMQAYIGGFGTIGAKIDQLREEQRRMNDNFEKLPQLIMDAADKRYPDKPRRKRFYVDGPEENSGG